VTLHGIYCKRVDTDVGGRPVKNDQCALCQEASAAGSCCCCCCRSCSNTDDETGRDCSGCVCPAGPTCHNQYASPLTVHPWTPVRPSVRVAVRLFISMSLYTCVCLETCPHSIVELYTTYSHTDTFLPVARGFVFSSVYLLIYLLNLKFYLLT